MNITAPQIARIVAELAAPLEGAFLNRLFQTGGDEWVFEFRAGDEKLWLLVSVSPRFSRLHLTPGPPEDRRELEPFAKLLKKTLVRRGVERVTQLNADRIVAIDFRTPGGGHTLVAELMGTRGNLYLLDHERKVIGAALARKSGNSPGQPYAPPDRGAFSDNTAPPASGATGFFAFNREMERRYADITAEDRLVEARRSALSPLKAALKKTEKRIDTLRKQKQALQTFEKHRLLGDLLQAHFPQIKKGMASITVANLFSPEQEPVDIALEPSKSPTDNVSQYYKRYRRFEKGVPRIAEELVALERSRSEALGKITVIQNAQSLKDLAPFLPGTERKPKTKRRKETPQTSGPRRFVTSEGYPVLVGRSDRENDEITFRIANGRDLWLHARDYPGSHVLVRLPKGVLPSPATIREAAMLALRYSKAAKSGKGEVTYCLAKAVKKPKGAAPGKALVGGAKSVYVKIDPEAVRKMKVG